MGLKYTQIPTDTFEKIQINAGILCNSFNTATGEVTGLIGATTGGLTVNCTPEFSDFGDDIDNCPKNTKELKKVVSYDVNASGNFVTVDATSAQGLIGAADNTSGKITPRMDLQSADFKDVWIIGDYSDVNTGASAGYIAVRLINVLNTSGFSWTTTDKGKGQFAFTYTGHTSIEDQETVPFELYVKQGTP